MKTIQSEKSLGFNIRIAKHILSKPELYARVAPGIVTVLQLSSRTHATGNEQVLKIFFKGSTLSGSATVKVNISEHGDSAHVSLVKGPFSLAHGDLLLTEIGPNQTLVRIESNYATNLAPLDRALTQKLSQYIDAVSLHAEVLAGSLR